MAASEKLSGVIGFICEKIEMDDYANWMGNLPKPFHTRPLHSLAIPGSHDSFSYTLSLKTEITPDEPHLLFLNKIPIIRTIAKVVVYRWSVTQHLSCTEQLESGVRYLDLRIALNPQTQVTCLVHGLYGISMQDALLEVLQFLKSHPTEVVLLDFQHYYNIDSDMHSKLVAKVSTIFDGLICPVMDNLEEVTLEWLWTKRYQVLIFDRYCDPPQRADDKWLWPASWIPNPWPNTVNPQRMLDFLQRRYEVGRPENKFYVTQGVLTPNTSFVTFHVWSTLERRLAKLVDKVFPEWLGEKEAGRHGINVVISDFIGSSACIAKRVIALNLKGEEEIDESTIEFEKIKLF